MLLCAVLLDTLHTAPSTQHNTTLDTTDSTRCVCLYVSSLTHTIPYHVPAVLYCTVSSFLLLCRHAPLSPVPVACLLCRVTAFWKGIQAAWLREASYTSLRIGLYGPIKQAMGKRRRDRDRDRDSDVRVTS